MKPLLALAILAALSLVAHGSVAADRTPLGWTLEVDPADGSEQSCDRERLVREVELACDALGKSCVVAGENEPRHAVLHCAKAWLLEARDAEGTLLWTMPINGDGDRIRQAAMWIARDSSEARLAAALPEHPSPEATTPVEATEKPPPPPAAPAPPPFVEMVSPPSVSPGEALAAARGGFAGTGFGPSFGGRIAAALAIASPNLALDVAVAATGAPQGSVNDAYVSGHLGAGIVWGAPWERPPWAPRSRAEPSSSSTSPAGAVAEGADRGAALRRGRRDLPVARRAYHPSVRHDLGLGPAAAAGRDGRDGDHTVAHCRA